MKFKKGQIPWNKGIKTNIPRCPDCGSFLGSAPHKCRNVDKKGPRFCVDCDKLLKNVGYERWHNICPRCGKIRWRENQKKLRRELIQQFGGACQICNYKKYEACLEFHHKNSVEKKGKHFLKEIQMYPKNFSLLCNRCHREYHIESANK